MRKYFTICYHKVPIEMLMVYFYKLLVLFVFIPLYSCSYDCLNKPDWDVRSCTSHKLGSYEDKTETDRALWTETSVSSAIRCSTLCMDDKSCVSYFHNKNTKTCKGHSIMFGNSTAASEEQGNRFYYYDGDQHQDCVADYYKQIGLKTQVKENVFGEETPIGFEGYIGDLCDTATDCLVTSSECRADCINTTTTSQCSERRCWCVTGYSFSPTQHECLPNCTEYGNKFMRTFLHFINYGNSADFQNISLQDCQQQCVQATSMSCRSIQFGATRLDCFLSSGTRLDVPDNQWFYDEWEHQYSYYQRDCV